MPALVVLWTFLVFFIWGACENCGKILSRCVFHNGEVIVKLTIRHCNFLVVLSYCHVNIHIICPLLINDSCWHCTMSGCGVCGWYVALRETVYLELSVNCITGDLWVYYVCMATFLTNTLASFSDCTCSHIFLHSSMWEMHVWVLLCSIAIVWISLWFHSLM